MGSQREHDVAHQHPGTGGWAILLDVESHYARVLLNLELLLQRLRDGHGLKTDAEVPTSDVTPGGKKFGNALDCGKSYGDDRATGQAGRNQAYDGTFAIDDGAAGGSGIDGYIKTNKLIQLASAPGLPFTRNLLSNWQ
jgi:hypothetical protein